jgi:hypothetical protein
MKDEHINAFPRFLEKVDIPDVCWQWTGGASDFGHGRMKIAGALVSPHRLAYEYFVGPIPEGKMVLHRCDNPGCVNPRHLFTGTNSDNMKDAAAKGRLAPQIDPSPWQGQNRVTAKLNDDAVREIRKAPQSEIRSLAQRFGVHRSVIYKVMKRKRWAHVQDAA